MPNKTPTPTEAIASTGFPHHRFLTAKEAAEFLGIPLYRIHELQGGRLPYLPGEPHLFERSDLIAYRDWRTSPHGIRAAAADWAVRAQFRRHIGQRGPARND